MCEYIEIKGARVNNLKNISVRLPRERFVVITGLSGSGKTSLAIDTLYAEGRRRYVESLSSYARQFLGQTKKPDCDFISGIPPAIAVNQKVFSHNSRSTVGTISEIYDYLKMLYARVGQTFSPISGVEVKRHKPQDIIECALQFSQGTRFFVMSPLIVNEGRTIKEQLYAEIMQGYTRVFVKGAVMTAEELMLSSVLSDIKEGDIWLIIDRLVVEDTPDFTLRLADSSEIAFYEGNGSCRLIFLPAMVAFDFSTRFEADGITFEEPNDNMFSFNSPSGACPECHGTGTVLGIDERLVIPNSSLSVYDGCVVCWHGEKMSLWLREFCRRATADNFPLFEPYHNLTKEQKGWLWSGLPSESALPEKEKICISSFFRMVEANQYKIQYRMMLSRFRGHTICPACRGTRLKSSSDYVLVGGRSIGSLVEMPLVHLKKWFATLKLSEENMIVGQRLITEILNRLQFLVDVGLEYLTLNRSIGTLSGGESQRLRLATSLGSGLVGSLYVLDEPSIGLHGSDTQQLITVLKRLADMGNTVVVVEHDEQIIRSADYIVDIGPEAGTKGGHITFAGKIESLLSDKEKHPKSHTIDWLTGKKTIAVPQSRRSWNRSITLCGAMMNNLRGIDAKIPLNVLVAITGVSGSGKSSLICKTLYPAIKRRLGDVCDTPGEYRELKGDLNAIKRIELVDQGSIGRSTRSNPVTYVKAYDAIRNIFAEQQLALQMGFTPQFFSFNTEGGRCQKCKGTGVVNVEMQFLADLTLECDACHGLRFKRDILDVKFKGKNIADILSMTVDEAVQFFDENSQQQVVKRLQPLSQVGLGYIKLGQDSSSLSGGENQRVKLAYFLSLEKEEPTLFIFDEPTTGLHVHDIYQLLNTFNALIARGHSIVVIEHNLEIIKCADYIIDLGPRGGDSGGDIVAFGTPEQVCQCKESLTGKLLKDKFLK